MKEEVSREFFRSGWLCNLTFANSVKSRKKRLKKFGKPYWYTDFSIPQVGGSTDFSLDSLKAKIE